MTKTMSVLVVIALAAMLAVGCSGTAQIVRRGSFSGELALTGDAYTRMDAAQLAILEHCGGRARVVTDAEAMALARADPGIAKATDEVRTIDGERLHYVCVTLASAAR